METWLQGPPALPSAGTRVLSGMPSPRGLQQASQGQAHEGTESALLLSCIALLSLRASAAATLQVFIGGCDMLATLNVHTAGNESLGSRGLLTLSCPCALVYVSPPTSLSAP